MEIADADDGGMPECLCSFTDSGSVESHRFFLARRTLLEMLRDRGFPVPDDDIALTLPAFRAKFGENPRLDDLRISFTISSDPPKKVLAIFCGTDPFKLSTVREISSYVNKERLTNLILILQNKMTSKARGAIKEIFKFRVEIFQVTELLVNITKHALKPRHELLNEEEKQKLLKKYNVVESQLPRMLESDAVTRYYGYEKGQIVKVTYDGELTGSHVTYRCIM
ncbi:DNA-directed RNA polymerase V subunit 5A-like [Canna indica]|uniref:DNA-directed RNA polymerase V subunit 5A-like n=1 Tax=Canna indica TaxID=4628 RepID=A0AAQ3Q4A6_9LILI|nr:DNA-directed RNA polymerase V subunit 5A-like [Canna indica]